MTQAGGAPEGQGGGVPRSAFARAATLLGLAILVAALCGLGVWQIQRRAWKEDLIARVDRRIHAAPVEAPGPADWPGITAARDEYLAVRLRGRFLDRRPALVRAVTDFGAGYWVMAPFQTDRGFAVLINRGFVPPERSGSVAPPSGPVTVTGLLRLSEPGGGFLHHNVPAQDRWYSRDVAAIAAARHVAGAAPYFVDAGAGDGWPKGGLTVIAFPNNHLVYALTWFGLALLVAGMAVRAWLGEGGSRRRPWKRQRIGTRWEQTAR